MSADADREVAPGGAGPMSDAPAVRWPSAPPGRPLYESLFLRAVDPASGAALWLRHTVQRTPGRADRGSAWCTLWSGDGVPHATKQTWSSPRTGGPEDTWIEMGAGQEPHDPGTSPDGGSDRGAGPPRDGDRDVSPPGGSDPAPPAGAAGPAGSTLGPRGTHGRIHATPGACWDLSFDAAPGPGLRHLPWERLYAAPLPKTKVSSPLTGLRVRGTAQVGSVAIALDDAPAVLGHNWGSEHAHRWLWLNGLGFDSRPDAWVDVAMARIALGPVVLPWAGIGALQLGERRIALGLSARRGPGRVRENAPGHLVAELPASGGGQVTIELDATPGSMVAWPYAQPGGGELHHSLNCSRAAIALTYAPRSGSRVELRSPVGGVLEQGVPASDPHPVPVLPFPDE